MNMDFPFFVYLRKCIRTVCIALCTVHWHVWLTLLIIIFLNALRVIALSVQQIDSFVYLSTIILWLSVFITFYISHNINSTLHLIAEQYDRIATRQKSHEELEEEEEMDEEEVLEEEQEYIMSGGVCCVNHKTISPQHLLFFMRSPANVMKVLQLAILVVAVSLPLYITDLKAAFNDGTHGQQTLAIVNLCVGIPPFILMLWTIPTIVPKFVIAISVASFSRTTQIRSTFNKIRSLKKKLEEKKHGKHHGHEEHGQEHGGHDDKHVISVNSTDHKHDETEHTPLNAHNSHH
jgi:type III secretory pathway component EscR